MQNDSAFQTPSLGKIELFHIHQHYTLYASTLSKQGAKSNTLKARFFLDNTLSSGAFSSLSRSHTIALCKDETSANTPICALDIVSLQDMLCVEFSNEGEEIGKRALIDFCSIHHRLSNPKKKRTDEQTTESDDQGLIDISLTFGGGAVDFVICSVNFRAKPSLQAFLQRQQNYLALALNSHSSTSNSTWIDSNSIMSNFNQLYSLVFTLHGCDAPLIAMNSLHAHVHVWVTQMATTTPLYIVSATPIVLSHLKTISLSIVYTIPAKQHHLTVVPNLPKIIEPKQSTTAPKKKKNRRQKRRKRTKQAMSMMI